MAKIYLLSLGCDKNRVDGETMVGALRAKGYEVINNPEQAAVIIINTCGFIKDAVQESIDTIFELAEYKKSGACRALVIVGCMAERYKDEIKETIPEADAFVGVGEYEKIAAIIERLVGKPENTAKNVGLPRLMARDDSDVPHIAYVKISDGCDNHCAYCTIPAIRGAYKARPSQEILDECRLLVEAGAVELVLVAQDTARYENLPQLLRDIAATSGAKWIRLMYAYPEHITPSLISALAEIPQMCKYLDMPIQHSEASVLSRMGRRGARRELEQLIRVLRDRVPGIALRTTVMVGFPGETAEDFKNLCDFVQEMKFDRMGAFPYSQEEGTRAALMPDQISDEIKQKRLNKIMQLQQKIHFKKQRKYVGKTLSVIVDGCVQGEYIGRTQYDAYEADAVVSFSSVVPLAVGQICDVRISDTVDYDLVGCVGLHE
ncbi:MAG: 30S ribosomal protein S12 methylthiotransferase RimO [Defluviitaleaceae bacterium]|nr:30S ribosomal protein S12 methylthiotransferase RimO [Defluviitaleaceae bacterium]